MSSDLWSLKGFAEASQSARTHAQSLLDKSGSFRLDTPKAQQLETSHVTRHEMQKPHRRIVSTFSSLQDSGWRFRVAKRASWGFDNKAPFEDLRAKSPASYFVQNWFSWPKLGHPKVTSCSCQRPLQKLSGGKQRSKPTTYHTCHRLAIDLP